MYMYMYIYISATPLDCQALKCSALVSCNGTVYGHVNCSIRDKAGTKADDAVPARANNEVLRAGKSVKRRAGSSSSELNRHLVLVLKPNGDGQIQSRLQWASTAPKQTHINYA